MEKKFTPAFHQNYIKAVRYCMAVYSLDKQKDAAEWLGIGRITLYKIMEQKQLPTVEQGISLCIRGNIDANWLFLNEPANVKGIIERTGESQTKTQTLSAR